MILYFTGTGNSKYLAKQIARRTGDALVDAAALIKQEEHPSFSSESPYVFVAPVYAWRLPRILADWMRQCSFEGSKEAYFIINCGSSIGAAEKYVRPLCRKLGFDCKGTAAVMMPENYIAMFSAPDEEEAAGIIARATEQVEALAEAIAEGRPLEPVKVSASGHLCSDVVNGMFYTFAISAKKFYATDACTGCGRCAECCMLNNIALQGGKPVWGKDCTHCMACICRCPAEAIEYGRHSIGKRRYTFPEE